MYAWTTLAWLSLAMIVDSAWKRAQHGWIGGHVPPQHLDRDLPLQGDLFRKMHFPHAPLAQLAENPEIAERHLRVI